jgi:LacI family transcriptional regulator
MNRKRVTMSTLAAELGLSRLTVSKALRGLPGMSLETRKAVLDLAEAKGYITREQKESNLFEHTSLMSMKARRFFFVLAGQEAASSHVIMELIRGLNDRYQSTNHQVVPVFIPDSCGSEGDGLEAWAEQSGAAYADGIFIPPMLPAEVEERLLGLSVPRILMNFPPVGAQVDSVIWDVYDAMRQAVSKLVQKGHRRILYVGNNCRTRGYKLRWTAFLEAMADAGIPTDPGDHHTAPFTFSQSWQQELRERLQRFKPTAILNAVEVSLPWVFYACSQAGIRIPEHCSLLSLDVPGDRPAPGASCFRMPIRETGYRAADRMIWRIANPSRPYEHIRLQGTFEDGGSIRSMFATFQPKEPMP